ncbi:MAG: extracellular solute-binding protein [Bacillota bacterium]
MKKIIFLIILAFLLLHVPCFIPVKAALEDDSTFMFDQINRKSSYELYQVKYSNMPRFEGEIVIPAVNATGSPDAKAAVLNGFPGARGAVLQCGDEGYVEWQVTVPKTGLYNMSVRYFPIEGRSSSIERELWIDGARPFSETRAIVFPRVWEDKTEIRKDNRNNDIMPTQIERPTWCETVVSDPDGLYKEPFEFYLTQGAHRIRFIASREPMVIDYIKLFQYKQPRPYQEILDEYRQKNYIETKGHLIKIQAEKPFQKSEPTLHPTYDKLNPASEPSDPAKLRYNTIGGQNWNRNGQWINWKIQVPANGLYKLGIKFRQDLVLGIPVTRSIAIDGKIPFKEVERIDFGYDTNWQLKTVGADKDHPYLFYLEKGEHTIKMEAKLGDISGPLRMVRQSSVELTQLYTNIIMITGVYPDPNKTGSDYELTKRLPRMVTTLKENGKIIRDQVGTISKITGRKASTARTLERVAMQLEDMAKDTDSIPRRLNDFVNSLNDLAGWVLVTTEQPLELDYLVLASTDQRFPNPNASFFRQALFSIQSFISSFTEDYSNVGNVYEDRGKNRALRVWVMMGRDQADCLKALIDEEFTVDTGVPVNINIIPPPRGTQVSLGTLQSENSLLFATSLKQSPDVALNVSRTLPVDYGIRGALQDLSRLKGFNEVKKRFMPSAFNPYQFRGKVYGLPETQGFPVFFYRKDIFSVLGLKVPNTWDELYKVVAALQNKNLQFGAGLLYGGFNFSFTSSSSDAVFDIFNAFLLQTGGDYYVKDGARSALDQTSAVEAFKKWTELYTNYGLPLYYSFYQRFRTGEMPAGIMDYTTCDLLAVAAPELKGIWGIAPIPGTLKPTGEIDRSVSGNGTASVMFKETDMPLQSWQFLQWWTSAQTQYKYGRALEALRGAAARYNSANVEAVAYLPWPSKDYKVLMEQWKHVKEFPVVPGSYYTVRYVNNAFIEVVVNGEPPREAMTRNIKEIDKELKKKREEFGIID